MKNKFIKAIASIMAIASLSVCSVSNFASAANEQPIETSVSMDAGASARSYHTLNLKDTDLHYMETVTGPGSVTLYANPTGSSVSLYVYKRSRDDFGNFYNEYVVNYSYDTTGNSPSHTVSLSSGTYYIYAKARSASSSNPVTGYVNIT